MRLILVIAAIFSSIYIYTAAVSVVNLTRENSRVVLDSFVTSNSTLIYDSIKQGTIIEGEEYIDRLCGFCTLDKFSDVLYNYNEDGSLKYKMTINCSDLSLFKNVNFDNFEIVRHFRRIS